MSGGPPDNQAPTPGPAPQPAGELPVGASISRDRALLDSIYQSVDVAIFVVDVDPDGTFRYAGLNPAHERLTGLRTDEVRGKTPAELVPIIPPETARAVADNYARCVAAGEAISYEEMIPFDGRHTWWLTRLAPLTDETGRLYRIVGTSTSITEQKLAEEALRRRQDELEVLVDQRTAALRATERLYQLSFEHAVSGQALFDLDGSFVQVNQALCDMLQADRQTLLGRHWHTVVHPQTMAALTDLADQLLEAGTPALRRTVQLLRSDQSAIWVDLNVVLIRDPDGAPRLYSADLDDISDKVTANQRLQQREELLSTIIETTADAIISINQEGNIELYNPAAERLFGRSAAEMRGNPPQILMPAAFRYQHDRDVEKFFATGVPGQGIGHVREVTGRHADGTDFPAEIALSSMTVAGRRYVIAVIRDITERKASEQALNESRARLQAILDHAPALITIKDLTGNLLVANNGFARIFGSDLPRTLVGSNVFDLFEPDVAAALWRNDLLALQADHPIEAEERMPTPDGSLSTYLSVKFPVRGSRGQVFGIGAISTDIADRIAAEIALRESRERLARVIDASSTGIWEWNIQTNEVYFSPRWKQLVGFEDHELENRFDVWVDLLHPDDRERMLTNVDSYLANPDGGFSHEFRMRHKDGSYRWILTRSNVELDEQGKPYRLSGSHLDITALKQAYQALARQAEELVRSNKELERFAYIASHDLQEPLRSVSSFVQLLSRRYKGQLDADADQFIDFAIEGVMRMKALIDGLLRYSRVGTRRQSYSQVDLEQVLSGVRANLQSTLQENQATLTWEALPTISADALQMMQLFQNLIGNAIKFRREEPPVIVVAARQEAERWHLTVADNGIGIEEAYQERVFEIFQRLHTRDEYDGTGIGLALCKRIVERHSGQIWFTPNDGGGTTFHISLPLAPAEEAPGALVQGADQEP